MSLHHLFGLYVMDCLFGRFCSVFMLVPYMWLISVMLSYVPVAVSVEFHMSLQLGNDVLFKAIQIESKLLENLGCTYIGKLPNSYQEN